MKILIPTCRDRSEIAGLLADVEKHSPRCDVFASCTKASASVNRNLCLDRLEVGEVAVMIDDDISGFYRGWLHDLLCGFSMPNVVMVSARLLKPDGAFGPTCSDCYEPEPREIAIKSNGTSILPTAAIAFRYTGIRFDNGFIGSGFEDSDWCQQILADDPHAAFLQSNRCRLTHHNEMKQQKGTYWRHNFALFRKKWKHLNAH